MDKKEIRLNAGKRKSLVLDFRRHCESMECDEKTAYEQSKAAAQTAQDRYNSGLGNLIILLETQRRAITAESQWWTARRRQLENRINLHLALGGGFKPTKKHGI